MDMVYKLPDDVFERLGGVATQDLAIWTCDICGPMTPVKYINGWMPGKCACQKADYQRQQEDKIRLQLWQAQEERNRLSCKKAFTWLSEDLETLRVRTFDTYDRTQFPAVYRNLKAFVTDTVDENGHTSLPPTNWLLFGNPGTGKTFIASAVVNALLEKNIPCRVMTGNGFFDALGQRISEHKDTTDLFQQAISVPLLLIDDVDKIHVPKHHLNYDEDNFQVKMMYRIINGRYLKGLPIIITTNKMDIIPYIGEASFSRLQENGRFIDMTGPDRRASMIKWE